MLNKLTLPQPLTDMVREHETINSLIVLDISSRHVVELSNCHRCRVFTTILLIAS